MKLKDMVELLSNNDACVVLKVKDGQEMNLISLGCFNGDEDLMNIDGVTGVEFDLNGFLDDIHQVIVLVGYDFRIVTRKLRLAVDVVNTAYLHGLEESGDRIEDYGEHLYLVFNCGPSWPKKG